MGSGSTFRVDGTRRVLEVAGTVMLMVVATGSELVVIVSESA